MAVTAQAKDLLLAIFYSLPCQRGNLDRYNKKRVTARIHFSAFMHPPLYCEKAPVRLVSCWVIKNIIFEAKSARTHARIQARLPENGAPFFPFYLPSPSHSLSLSVSVSPTCSLSFCLFCSPCSFLSLVFFSSRLPHPPPPSNNPLCPLSLSPLLSLLPMRPPESSLKSRPSLFFFSRLFFSFSNLSLSLLFVGLFRSLFVFSPVPPSWCRYLTLFI